MNYTIPFGLIVILLIIAIYYYYWNDIKQYFMKEGLVETKYGVVVK